MNVVEVLLTIRLSSALTYSPFPVVIICGTHTVIALHTNAIQWLLYILHTLLLSLMVSTIDYCVIELMQSSQCYHTLVHTEVELHKMFMYSTIRQVAVHFESLSFG